MALGWSEIRSRAVTFAYEWKNANYEKGESQTFWNEFFAVFGIDRKRVAVFEKRVSKLGEKSGFVDMLWKGVLLIEQKSIGHDLDKAYKQATDYFPGLTDDELPRCILVCNFQQFRLYDLIGGSISDFSLAELPSKVELFAFMLGLAQNRLTTDEKVSIAAAEKMAQLHDCLESIGYKGRHLEQYLVRLLFCMFADDTSIFNKSIFRELIASTKEDGSDLAQVLSTLFERLNTPFEKRLRIEDGFSEFPYINGDLFADTLPIAAFNPSMRQLLRNSCAFDWAIITPSIFGSMFQAAMSEEQRRNLGAHYTEEDNIMKIVNPLFMEDLHNEFEQVKHNRKQLLNFHNKLASLKFLDPACGTGNFLIIAYRELRRLEIKVLEVLNKKGRAAMPEHIQMTMEADEHSKVNVDQFYGIEIDELACEIARVGMWLMDHQCNIELSNALGSYYVRLPLTKAAIIHHGNALTTDWNTVCPAGELNYILGNPPFIGKMLMTDEQKAELEGVVIDTNNELVKGAGTLDYVVAWYYKSAQLVQQNKNIRAALVSTNSISQGEQTTPVWKTLIENYKLKIDFAYRTFVWQSAARGRAAVHCVIVGFSHEGVKTVKRIFDGEIETIANNISPYLLDAANIYLANRTKPICDVPQMHMGVKPVDGGFYLFTEQEKAEFLLKEPSAVRLFKRYYGSEEFINAGRRYYLDASMLSPTELSKMPIVKERVASVRAFRTASKKPATRKLASTPTLPECGYMPKEVYLLVPSVSSENRDYIPIGFMAKDSAPSNACTVVPNATLYHFGVLTSSTHMAWVRAVCGRMKSDYRYSAGIVYNNFPWPEPSEKQRTAIEEAAQVVLSVRNDFSNESLAKLYDPTQMPPKLTKAHEALNKAVKNAYGGKGFVTEAERVADLMERYQKLVGKK